jgi:hypothetical protein
MTRGRPRRGPDTTRTPTQTTVVPVPPARPSDLSAGARAAARARAPAPQPGPRRRRPARGSRPPGGAPIPTGTGSSGWRAGRSHLSVRLIPAPQPTEDTSDRQQEQERTAAGPRAVRRARDQVHGGAAHGATGMGGASGSGGATLVGPADAGRWTGRRDGAAVPVTPPVGRPGRRRAMTAPMGSRGSARTPSPGRSPADGCPSPPSDTELNPHGVSCRWGFPLSWRAPGDAVAVRLRPPCLS